MYAGRKKGKVSSLLKLRIARVPYLEAGGMTGEACVLCDSLGRLMYTVCCEILLDCDLNLLRDVGQGCGVVLCWPRRVL